ncbi:DNA helicase RecG [Candidatus Marinamargulisbacteria bacterium SCGC AG-343-D04]|nr:DNA helicase RecG [Candidatus Marinamargulisbacteria bacterium SCGC AG-343-D04]
MGSLSLATEVQYLKGVGPRIAKLLTRLDIWTIKDCLFYFPREYDDRRALPSINKVYSGEIVTILCTVETLKEKQVKKGMHIIEAVVTDKTGRLTATWFNQSYLYKQLFPGITLILKGKVENSLFYQTSQLQVQNTEIIRSQQEMKESTGLVIPVYGLTAGLYQTQMRAIMKSTLELGIPLIKDNMSEYITTKFNLIELKNAIKEIHLPRSVNHYKEAKQRIVFDEFIYYQLRLERQRLEHKKRARSSPLITNGTLAEQYRQSLPYTLTNAQKRVVLEIQEDIAGEHAMNRLLQGDVGSGKTDVAILTLLAAIDSKKSGVIMAPTEILAIQHYLRIRTFLEKYHIKCWILKSKMKKKEKLEAVESLRSGEPSIVIGTHALLQEYVSYSKCGVIVIDEQHRFGVMQRIVLQDKGSHPHCLFMTATPIPRTFMLTCFGDLDKSTIDELPPGRIPAQTTLVPDHYIGQVYQSCVQRLRNGEQMYIVYPLVEESEKLDLKSAMEGFETVKSSFSEFKVGLIHGRMKSEEKQDVMEKFKESSIHILVSTTVIEVGIDVPNATIMVIHHAERFGLSQLHQLRGRIGRGGQNSACYLMSNSKTETAKQRLKAMVETHDGFKIAEYDLKIRGPGDILGTKQSGLPDFYLADLVQDEKILITAKKVAQYILEKDPLLEKSEHQSLKEEMLMYQDSVIGQHLN